MKKANYVFLAGEREEHSKNFPFLEGVEPEVRKMLQEFYEVGSVCREQIGRFQIEGVFQELLIFVVNKDEGK